MYDRGQRTYAWRSPPVRLSVAVLDATGLVCPLPVLKARKLLKAMEVGEVLEVTATDPAAARDFAAFCSASGHQLIEKNKSEDRLYFRIRKLA